VPEPNKTYNQLMTEQVPVEMAQFIDWFNATLPFFKTLSMIAFRPHKRQLNFIS
jgi:hypothetical protein